MTLGFSFVFSHCCGLAYQCESMRTEVLAGIALSSLQDFQDVGV